MSVFHRIPSNAICRGIISLAASLCFRLIPNSSVIQWQKTKFCAKRLAKPEAPVYVNLKVMIAFRIYQAFAWGEVQPLREHFGFVHASQIRSRPQRSVCIIVLSLGIHKHLRRININFTKWDYVLSCHWKVSEVNVSVVFYIPILSDTGSNSRSSPLAISPSANMIFTVDRILNYSNECCHKQVDLHWTVNNKNSWKWTSESCHLITWCCKLQNVFGVKFEIGVEDHKHSAILSVLDPRKCEYLKDYSLDFEHAYMTTYIAS